jgi:hypothetical protein
MIDETRVVMTDVSLERIETVMAESQPETTDETITESESESVSEVPLDEGTTSPCPRPRTAEVLEDGKSRFECRGKKSLKGETVSCTEMASRRNPK